MLNGESHTQPESETKGFWVSTLPPFLFLPFHPYLTQCCFHLLPPSTKWMLCCCWDPASQGRPLPRRHYNPPTNSVCLISVLLFFLSLSLFPQAHKCSGFHFTENTFCCNCCAVRFQGCRITGYIQAFRYTLADQCPTDPPKPAI